MKTAQVDNAYRRAMKESRAAKKHGKAPLGIKELLEKPAFSGFIDVTHLKGISVCMFLAENDDGVALRCAWNGAFEPMSTAMWAALARGAAGIYDVGAHSGIYSLIAAAANDAARVISIEPWPINYARLCMNLRVNGFRPDFAVNAAVSNAEGLVPFSVNTPAWYLSTGGAITDQPTQTAVPVNCSTVDAVARMSGIAPDLMKIDVEGHELAVLEGARTVLAGAPDLILESVFNTDTAAIEALLTSFGYRFYIIDDGTLTLTPVEHLRPASEDGADMERLNRLATTRPHADIQLLAKSAVSMLR